MFYNLAMARKSKTKSTDEIEVVFGFKQVLGLILLGAGALCLAYLSGFESGHRRALRGDPSLLGFLEKKADTHTEPVAIPDVLIQQLDAERAKIQAASGAEQAAAGGEQGQAAAQAKPTAVARPRPVAGQPPAGETIAEEEPPAATAPDPKPAGTVPAREEAQGSRLHYQVAALNSRQNAKGLVDWLRAQGLPGQIRPADDDGLYRVVVGPFPNDRDAESAKVRLARDGFAVMVRRL